MHTIKVYTKSEVYEENISEPYVAAKDIFCDFKCPNCSYKGVAIGRVYHEHPEYDGAGIIKCPRCEYEEEY